MFPKLVVLVCLRDATYLYHSYCFPEAQGRIKRGGGGKRHKREKNVALGHILVLNSNAVTEQNTLLNNKSHVTYVPKVAVFVKGTHASDAYTHRLYMVICSSNAPSCST